MTTAGLPAPVFVSPRALPRLLLGSEVHQRLRTSQCLLALGLNSMFALIQHCEATLGMLPLAASNWLTVFNVGASLCFFVSIRTGLNERLAPREPSLTLPQCLTAVTALAWSYAITGPARGALLALLILIIQFGGLFRLDQKQTRLLSLYAFLLIAGVMLWRTAFAAERYDPHVELIHFTFTMVVLFGANVVAGRFGVLRARLSRQKADLAAALELNRELATRDLLTGLLNRRAMVEMLVRPPSRAPREDGLMTVAMLDIDRFKNINDQCGHGAGDRVLHRFAKVLSRSARKGDLIARWGGEEFLLLMPGTTPQDGLQALARLREDIHAIDWSDVVGALPVSFSAGLAGHQAGDPYEPAIERADQALYRAKQGGRDRIEVA